MLAAGCSGDGPRDDSPGGGAGGAAAGAGGASTFGAGTAGGVDPGTGGGFCEGKGPAIELPIFGDCTGDIAKKTFLFAICACENINYGSVTTDSFNSETGAVTNGGGSVGVNGTYVDGSSSASHIGGSLWTRASTTLTGDEIAGDLQCGGDLVAQLDPAHIRGDAFLQGTAAGSQLVIDGRLHAPPGQAYPTVVAAGGEVREAVSVPPPCNCDDPIDIRAAVSHFAANNDNALVGLATDALAANGDAFERTLPCGRYYLDKIGGSQPITFHLTGRTVIAVRESIIHDSTPIIFDIGPDAELDLFVDGNVQLEESARIGSRERPAATRMYIAGQFGYEGQLDLAANVYVPNAAFAGTSGGTEIWGSLFAKNIGVAGDIVVHYDEAILDVDGCAPPDGSCGSCHDCANPSPACHDGACGPCQADSDCCPPLHCDAGACVPDDVIR